MNVIFMGTPDYAVPTLKAFADSEFNVQCVFCQPDKPVGRKQILTPPPVKTLAEEYGIPVYQPQSFKNNEEIVSLIKEYSPDFIVVVAYGKILPQSVLDIPKYGSVNGHGSLLPKYRGSAPIQWSVVCGEKETGVTAMYMDAGVDTGDIIDTYKTEIGYNETAEELYERLSVATAELLLKTVRNISSGNSVRIPQNNDEATYAPMINKEMALLDFNEDAEVLRNKIRGFNSWPVAYTYLSGKRFKIFSADTKENLDKAPGVLTKIDGNLYVSCGNNTSLLLNEIQIEGSKRMTAKEMLIGHKIENGTVLGI